MEGPTTGTRAPSAAALVVAEADETDEKQDEGGAEAGRSASGGRDNPLGFTSPTRRRSERLHDGRPGSPPMPPLLYMVRRRRRAREVVIVVAAASFPPAGAVRSSDLNAAACEIVDAWCWVEAQ